MIKKWYLCIVLAALALLAAATVQAKPPARLTAGGTTSLVSVASDGTQANDDTYNLAISADGRYVAFESDASNLVGGDTNADRDIFVHDRQTGETARVSVASDGTQGNNWSYEPDLSADGRYIAFRSAANNLVGGDTNGRSDIFIHDRQITETIRVSVASDGTPGNNTSSSLAISADGRYVAFTSVASNLVVSDTNGVADIFVHDRQITETIRVSIASDGTQGNDASWYPAISADGRYVAFYSEASNLVVSDTNSAADIFIHDRQTGDTTRVSVSSDGAEGNAASSGTPSISADGRYVAFESEASNHVSGDNNGFSDIFVHDLHTGETSLVSSDPLGVGSGGDSMAPTISADGRYVTFHSDANNLVEGDSNGIRDVFRHDRQTGRTILVSVSSDGTQGNDDSLNAAISADGRVIAFLSAADNLVSGDVNGFDDVFAHELPDSTPSAPTLTGITPASGTNADLVHITNLAGSNFQAGATVRLARPGQVPIHASNVSVVSASQITCDFDLTGAITGTWNVVVTNPDDQSGLLLDGFTLNVSPTAPIVTGITPVSGADTGLIHITDLAGSNFQAGASVKLTRPGLAPIQASNVSVVSASQIACDFDLARAAAGEWDVVVTNPDGQSGVLTDGFRLNSITSGVTTRVSVKSDGTQASNHSYNPAISADGRYVAFGSDASNLAPGDHNNTTTNSMRDVFVHDRQITDTTRITGGTRASYNSSISADGRYVAFYSYASNLVVTDTNQNYDVFVHDRLITETVLVSIASDGAQGNRGSFDPAISTDGRYVAFASDATNLVSDTNDSRDIFVHDRQITETIRVSIASDGTQGNGSSYSPDISADGRYVAFYSYASNLVGGDTNGNYDIFVHDRQTGETSRVSVASDGTQGNDNSSYPAISADGRYVVFHSAANNLVGGDTNGFADVFIHDRQTGETSLISVDLFGIGSTGDSFYPSISADGRYVTFRSTANNLVGRDTNGRSDIFRHDRQMGRTILVSVSSDGTQGNGNSYDPAISADGRVIAFESYASNLVSGDTGRWDIFVHELPESPTGPLVTGITPNSGVNTGTVRITNLSGDNFQAGAAVRLSMAGQPDINAINVTVVSSFHITCDLDLAGAAPGEWDVVVTNPDDQIGTLRNGFRVKLPPGTKTWNGSLSSDWHTAGNWTPNAVPTAEDDALIPDVSSAGGHQPVISNGDAVVNSLVISPNAVLDLTDRLLNVESGLTNNGALRQTLDMTTGGVNFLHITNLVGDQIQYNGLVITPTARIPASTASHAASPAPAMLRPNGALAYGIETYPGTNLVSFSTDPPVTPTAVANIDYGSYAIDFVGSDASRFYAVDSLTNQFVSIDTATAAVSVISTASPASGHGWSGLAGDPTDGSLYAVSTDGSVSRLYTFDPATGASLAVGDVTTPALLSEIAINSAGEMYGMSAVSDVLVRIDKATGASTVIGSLGFDASQSQGLDFDEATDVLYLSTYNLDAGAEELRVVDTITGGTTLVGAFPGETVIDALAIIPVNIPPVAVNDAYTTSVDTPLSVAAPGVLGNDSDADPLTAVLDAGPTNGMLSLGADGSFVYTPTAIFSGTDSFTYQASDGAAVSNIATVTLTVTAANVPPVAVDDTYTTPPDTPLRVAAPGVLGNDSDADGDALTAVLGAGPTNGTLSLSADGSFVYTPTASFSGSDSFTYYASDGIIVSETATVAIEVASLPSISVTVTISGNQFCADRAGGVRRCFDITPSAPFTATVRFYFGEAERNGQILNNLLVYHYDGDWIEEVGPYIRGGTGDAQYVEVQNVDGFSPFALSGSTIYLYLPVVMKQ